MLCGNPSVNDWRLVYGHQELWYTEDKDACATVYFSLALQETVMPYVCADGYIDTCIIALRDKMDCHYGMHLPVCKGMCSCAQGTVPQGLGCGPGLQQWGLSETSLRGMVIG